jgi:hypothetical protein
MSTSDPIVKCAICGRPVSLETAKFSENGKPVHEECYLAKIKGELRKSPSQQS